MCTWRRAHPVGRKANKLEKMSPTVRLRNTNIITSVTINPMNRISFRSLNISWKSALNFFLPIDTICKTNTKYVQLRQPKTQSNGQQWTVPTKNNNNNYYYNYNRMIFKTVSAWPWILSLLQRWLSKRDHKPVITAADQKAIWHFLLW